jgi:hypothetical protein
MVAKDIPQSFDHPVGAQQHGLRDGEADLALDCRSAAAR